MKAIRFRLLIAFLAVLMGSVIAKSQTTEDAPPAPPMHGHGMGMGMEGHMQFMAAKLNLSRTVVRAPMAGEVAGAERLLPGQLVVQNVPMLTLVGISGAYVEANYKETQLADMRVGQPAEIKFDAYPGMKLRGHVAAIGAGTGSEFSVLPAQNATGNWVKVTQRVPVRIAIDSKSDRKLIAGLTTHVTVFTDGKKH